MQSEADGTVRLSLEAELKLRAAELEIQDLEAPELRERLLLVFRSWLQERELIAATLERECGVRLRVCHLNHG